MPWDLTKPVNDTPAIQADIRANFQAAKAATEAACQVISGTSLQIQDSLYGDHNYIRRLFTAGTGATATLGPDVAIGRFIELVSKNAAGSVAAAAGLGAVLRPIAGTGNWPAGLHSTTNLNEALVYTVDPPTPGDAPTRDGAATTGAEETNTGTSLTVAHTVGSNPSRILLVGAVAENTDGNEVLTSVTYGGTAMTQIALANSSSRTFAAVYYMLNPSSGTANVVISANSGMVLYGVAANYYGVAQVAPTIFNAVTGSGLTSQNTLSNVPPGHLVFSVLGGSGGFTGALSPSVGTELFEDQVATPESASAAAAEYFPPHSDTQNVSLTWTYSVSSQARLAHAAVAIAPATIWRQVSRP